MSSSSTKRTFALALVLAGSLSACAGSSGKTDSVGSQPSPTAAATATGTGSCTPSGTGTTDLKTKPVFTVTKAPAPTTTTIIDIVCGTGAEAKEGSAVTVKYVGVNYADGKEFDSSWKRGPNETLPFSIGSGVIAGFSKGTSGMKVGGRREVIITPADGYGDSGPVPGGTLVFFIDLVTVS
ncbi:MAG: Peptidylprolyl isomerase [Frankiales bacterium]|nr:Peptidylprolyl isomerase [Frankiales bacterium]